MSIYLDMKKKRTISYFTKKWSFKPHAANSCGYLRRKKVDTSARNPRALLKGNKQPVRQGKPMH